MTVDESLCDCVKSLCDYGSSSHSPTTPPSLPPPPSLTDRRARLLKLKEGMGSVYVMRPAVAMCKG